MIFNIKNKTETRNLAEYIIKKLNNFKTKKAKILAFKGDLGSGKTTLIKELAKRLGVKEKVKSPTFILIKKYKTINYKLKAVSYFYHIDCYRLKNSKDLITLGIKDILENKNNIVAIEWAERIRNILPKKHISIHIDHTSRVSENKRKITIKTSR